eukprot:ANDGO_03392.mRNA.1 UVB-resistance protein UVR8
MKSSVHRSFSPLIAVNSVGQVAIATPRAIHFSWVPACWAYPPSFGYPKFLQFFGNQLVVVTTSGTCHLFENYAANPVPILTSRPVRHVCASSGHRMLVVSEDCNVFMFHRDSLPSQSQREPSLRAVKLDFLDNKAIRRVGSSEAIGIALSKDGSVFVWFWSNPEPTLRHITPPVPFKSISVSERTNYVLFRTVDGQVFSCGSGKYGVLGHGGYGNEFVPRKLVALNGVEVATVAAANTFALCLSSEGRCYRWGTFGKSEVVHLPQEVESTGSTNVAAAAGSSNGVILSFSLSVDFFWSEQGINRARYSECEELTLRLRSEEQSSSENMFFDSLMRRHFEKRDSSETSHLARNPESRSSPEPFRRPSPRGRGPIDNSKKRRDLSFYAVDIEKNLEDIDAELNRIRHTLVGKPGVRPHGQAEHIRSDSLAERRSSFSPPNRLVIEDNGEAVEASYGSEILWKSADDQSSTGADSYDALAAEIDYLSDALAERDGELAVWKVAGKRLMELLQAEKASHARMQKEVSDLRQMMLNKEQLLQRQLTRSNAWIEEVQTLERTSKALIESKNSQIKSLQNQVDSLSRKIETLHVKQGHP